MPDARINPSYLLIGEILRPHGIRGELRVKIHTDYPERVNKLKQVYISRSPEDTRVTPHSVEHMRMHHDYGLLKLKAIDDRNQADLMRGLFVMVKIQDAVPLEDDEIYLFQLIGLHVRTEAGEELGTIIEVLETGANDVYLIDSPTYGELLFPATDQTLVQTDPDAGIIIVKLPEGLIPES